MGHYVTIEGSLTPTDALPRGVRRTVAVTDEVRKLVRIGGAVVVAGSLDASEPEPADHTGVTENDPSGVTPMPTGDFAPANEPTIGEQSTDEPDTEDEPKARRTRARANGES